MAQERIIRILFVCHGNICRSPMAEYIMKHLVEKRGLSRTFMIDSAATSTEELGNPVYPPARRMLEAQGIGCGDHRARQIRRDEASEWDLIVVMDEANVRNIKRRIGESSRVYKLLEFAGESRDVADPWYTGDFEATFDDCMAGCTGLLGYLGY